MRARVHGVPPKQKKKKREKMAGGGGALPASSLIHMHLDITHTVDTPLSYTQKRMPSICVYCTTTTFA